MNAPPAKPHAAPLHGITVLDFSELLPGPFLTQSLAELGATVIKVERPPGDRLRVRPALFEAVNSGKQCQVVDLRSNAGQAQVRQWLERADILVEAYRPGVMARHGLDYSSLASAYPRLIYLSLTGYGQTGPDATLPGHDINYLAASGALALSGTPDQAPCAGAGVPLADLCGASYGLASVLAALYQREHTGAGQHLDVALADSVAHWMNSRSTDLREAGLDTPQARRAALVRPAYGAFRCRDGRYLSVAAIEDHFWKRLVLHLDLSPYDGTSYATAAARYAQTTAINERLAQALAGLEANEAFRRLRTADVPVMLMLEPGELNHSAQAQARGLLVDTPAGPLCRFPVRLHGMAP